MNAIRFALRSLLRQPGRTTLGVVGIAAVGALLFDMLLLSRGLVVSFRDLLDSIGFDVRVTASNSPIPGGERMVNADAAAALVATLPEVSEVVLMRTANGELVVANGRGFDIGLTAVSPGRRRPWTLMSGADLDKPSEHPPILVNQRTFDRLGLPIGSAVLLRVTCQQGRVQPSPQLVTLSGIAQFPFDDEGQRTGALALSALRDICGDASDDADMLMVASSGGADRAVAAIKRARPDLFPVTNEEIVARMQAQGFTYFRQISAVLSTITLIFGFLLVAVLLTVSVNQRLAEIAALRALGFSSRRVAVDVLAQGSTLVAVGGVLALPLGLLLSLWLDRILKAMPGIPASMHFFVFEPQALYWHVLLLAATALLASAYPVWLVARLPIAATLRNEVVG